MSVTLLTNRFLREYGRRPLNLVLLAAVPVVFVVLAAQPIADFAELLGGAGTGGAQASLTAGWAAAFLAGVAGYFHVLSSRTADRRLASAGMGAGRIVAARLLSGLLLAAVASLGALAALWLRTGLGDPLRITAITFTFAVLYLAIGTAIGTSVRNEVNGSLLVVFVWMLDVFLGPGMAGGDVWLTRLFPTHFPTLVALSENSGHAGWLGDVAASALWVGGMLALATVLFIRQTRPRGLAGAVRHTVGSVRLVTGLRYAFREHRRNLALWLLLFLLPVGFITLSFAVTPDTPAPVQVPEHGDQTLLVSMIDLHGAIMVPITVAFLAGLAGMFVVQNSAEADRRLTLAGFHTWEVLTARLGVIVGAAVLTTAVSLGVTALDFEPASWVPFTGATLLVAVQYGLVGVLVGSLLGRVGGLYMMFLLPFVDVGIAQNVMFAASPPAWGSWLPAHGPVRMLVDSAFSPSFDTGGALLLGLAWTAALAVAGGTIFHRLTRGATQ